MKLGDICSAPCLSGAFGFEIPVPGCGRKQLQFGNSEGRDYYAVLLRNHDLQRTAEINPRVAIVGLSPAATQIDEFVSAYRQSGDYADAAIKGAFAGLSREIIAMMNGLGLSSRLDLALTERTSFAHHPDIYVTSLVACATLTTTGSSTDFDPSSFEAARRCVGKRFVAEMLNPRFDRLSHVLILGSKGWNAISNVRTPDGQTVLKALEDAGKTVLNIPHPSGANREYVNLASLSANQAPSLADYCDSMWSEYQLKPAKPGRGKQSETAYKAKRRTIWQAVDRLRSYATKLGNDEL